MKKQGILIAIIFMLSMASAIALGVNVSTANSKIDANDTMIIKTCAVKDGACCLGDVCSKTQLSCIQGSQPRFLGCSDSCEPKLECIKIILTASTCSIPVCKDEVKPLDTGKLDSNNCKVYYCEIGPDADTDVCCESFGYGTDMVKTPSTYEIIPKEKCVVATGFVGGGKNVVNMSYCADKPFFCPVDCKCSDSGEILDCQSYANDATIIPCPSNCKCDDFGKIVTCYKTLTVPSGINVTKDINEKNVIGYYKQKLDAIMMTNDTDAKIIALKEMQTEIDKTIKNLIEQKKNLNFSDMKDVAQTVTITPISVKVGNSAADSSNVTIGVNVGEGDTSNVIVSTGEGNVWLSEGNLKVKTNDVTIDDNGLNIQGINVKLSPGDILDANKNLDSNRLGVKQIVLDKEGDNAVYTADYDAKRKILGVIPVIASQEIKIDAESGQVISEKKPWWTFIAS